jgi:hypothetical protein
VLNPFTGRWRKVIYFGLWVATLAAIWCVSYIIPNQYNLSSQLGRLIWFAPLFLILDALVVVPVVRWVRGPEHVRISAEVASILFVFLVTGAVVIFFFTTCQYLATRG